jgi:hypothetical protein
MITLMPVCARLAAALADPSFCGDMTSAGRLALPERRGRGGDAARHLQIDQAVTTRLRRTTSRITITSAARAHRPGDAQFTSDRPSRSRWRVTSIRLPRATSQTS